MSNRYLDNLLPDFGEYSVESFLESYRQRAAAQSSSTPPAEAKARQAQTAEAIAQRSRQIVMEALGETMFRPTQDEEPVSHKIRPDDRAKTAPALEKDEDPTRRRNKPAAEEKAAPHREAAAAAEAEPTRRLDRTAPSRQTDSNTAAAEETESTPAPLSARNRVHVSPDGIITLDLDLAQPEEKSPAAAEDAVPPEEPDSEPEAAAYAPEETSGEDYVPEWDRPKPRTKRDRGQQQQQQDRPGFADRFLGPIVRMAATRIARRQMQKAEAASWPDPVDLQETEELTPSQANKFYVLQLRPLRFRLRVSFLLCVTLAWISMGLPMAGLLGKSVAVQAGVSLVLLMTVMMASLDILAAGVRQLFELRPGAEALAFLAALMNCVDAMMVMAGYGVDLPFCAPGAFALAAALWGEKLDCVARARSMRMAAISKNPAVVTVRENERGGRYLGRSQRAPAGIVRRSEEIDFCQDVYATASPILMAACLLLAVMASTGGRGSYFLHTLSAMLSVSASFTAFLSFPLPYSVAARKLQASGAAIMGYAGCADIGRTRRLVISDGDLFPPGTMKLSGINILEGAKVEKVVAGTTSLLVASGSGVSGVFMELVTRRGYALVQPQEFRCHEGGGLSARVNDEQILVGSPGFMNLMGIRLPQNMVAKNAVCTAISGELVGVFTLEYIPVTSVQDALVTLLQGRTQPIFAIRDFNITPLMIRQLFRLPTESFNFPTFRDRYRIAGGGDEERPASAILGRSGMGPLVDAAETGRKLYGACRLGTIISLAGTVIGLVTMFLLCRAGSYATATAGNVLSYMLLWALPVAILAFGQNR